MRISTALILCFMALSVRALAYGSEDAVGWVPYLLEGTSGQGSLACESSLGDAAADAVRRTSGAEIAAVFGGSFRSNLLGGEAKYSDVLGALNGDPELAVSELTYAELRELLENSVSHMRTDSDTDIDWDASAWEGFLQVSGLSFQYDISAPVGERVRWIRIGSETIDMEDGETTVRIAGTAGLFEGAYGYRSREYEPLPQTLGEALADAIGAGINEEALKSTRISVMGYAGDRLFSDVPPLMVITCVAAIVAVSAVFRRAKPSRADFMSDDY